MLCTRGGKSICYYTFSVKKHRRKRENVYRISDFGLASYSNLRARSQKESAYDTNKHKPRDISLLQRVSVKSIAVSRIVFDDGEISTFSTLYYIHSGETDTRRRHHIIPRRRRYGYIFYGDRNVIRNVKKRLRKKIKTTRWKKLRVLPTAIRGKIYFDLQRNRVRMGKMSNTAPSLASLAGLICAGVLNHTVHFFTVYVILYGHEYWGIKALRWRMRKRF